ncbi:MAG: GTPase Era [Proteobacteria bacterium]|nr:GTPase Era [Pseudomonadota bacterium]
MNQKRCGYVALLGQPNAGKSTLMNACLGTKLAVVSAKPQTTRNKILGICASGDSQILFLDTPGIHKTGGLPKLNRKMNATAWSVLQDADLVCYLVDAAAGWSDEDEVFFTQILKQSSKPLVVIATKTDKVKAEVINQNIELMTERMRACSNGDFTTQSDSNAGLISGVPMAVSAKRPEEIEKFREFVSSRMPDGAWLYSEDDLTDRPQQFVCGELIREQLFRQLGQELPYSAAVKVERFQNKGGLTILQASVIVHKDNHKAMVIGARGSRIKAIGQAARESLEKHLGRKVHLELFVKVQSNWIDSDNLLAEYAGLDNLEE